VLDVGYNEGWVICQIRQFRGAHQVVGVDIDDTLIRAAWKRRCTVWSLQSPERGNTNEDSFPPHLGDTTITDDGAHNYFPASCEHSYSPLPITDGACGTFPHNFTFRTVNWVKDDISEDQNQYDIVLGSGNYWRSSDLVMVSILGSLEKAVSCIHSRIVKSY
ncbi:hypothetical protein BDR04DRAFT_1030656, partial [Suillus decipiens]